MERQRRRARMRGRRNSSCPMDIGALRRSRYVSIEPGVRDVVRLLVQHGFHPVWSCEGHRDSAQPEWLEFVTDRDRAVVKSAVRWDRPIVICAGGTREASRASRFLDGLACRIRIVKCEAVEPPSASVWALRRAAPAGTRQWFMLSFPGQRRPRLREASNAL